MPDPTPTITYKVCLMTLSGPVSLRAMGKWRVKYTLGKPAHGYNGTPLFSYDALEHAMDHVCPSPPRVVFKAEAVNARPAPKRVPSDSFMNWRDDWLRFWNGELTLPLHYVSSWQVLDDTVLSDSLTLIEQIYPFVIPARPESPLALSARGAECSPKNLAELRPSTLRRS